MHRKAQSDSIVWIHELHMLNHQMNIELLSLLFPYLPSIVTMVGCARVEGRKGHLFYTRKRKQSKGEKEEKHINKSVNYFMMT